jgi:hypothetical protein
MTQVTSLEIIGICTVDIMRDSDTLRGGGGGWAREMKVVMKENIGIVY